MPTMIPFHFVAITLELLYTLQCQWNYWDFYRYKCGHEERSRFGQQATKNKFESFIQALPENVLHKTATAQDPEVPVVSLNSCTSRLICFVVHLTTLY
jgi:hypothetical protein